MEGLSKFFADLDASPLFLDAEKEAVKRLCAAETKRAQKAAVVEDVFEMRMKFLDGYSKVITAFPPASQYLQERQANLKLSLDADKRRSGGDQPVDRSAASTNATDTTFGSKLPTVPPPRF